MTDINEFQIADRKISGSIQRGDKKVLPQISAQEFLDAIDKVLAVEGVTGLVWDQYTPYFNDGDPCEFSVREVRVLIGKPENDIYEDDEEAGLFEDSYREYSTGYTLSDLFEYADGKSYDDVWKKGHSAWSDDPQINKDAVNFITTDGRDMEPVFDALLAFPKSGTWESVAQQSFGDHAEVTATKDGFSVDFYEHD